MKKPSNLSALTIAIAVVLMVLLAPAPFSDTSAQFQDSTDNGGQSSLCGCGKPLCGCVAPPAGCTLDATCTCNSGGCSTTCSYSCP